MSRLRVRSLRARLLATAVAGAVVIVGALVVAFNIVLEARLLHDADNVLRDRASAQLRTLAVVDGRLSVPEAPDRRAPDTQTWVFAGRTPLEQPATDPRNQRAALGLVASSHAFMTVQGTDTRLHAVPVAQSRRPLGTLIVGESLRPYNSSARTALVGSAILGLLTVLVIAAVSRWMIGRALAPVARMTNTAADWSEHDLSGRFYVGEPYDELTALAATFDQLLERITQSLRHEQHLTAEISHELRTPLAKIMAEADLGMSRERTPRGYRRALASIRASAEQLAGVLDTLLTAARTGTSDIPHAVDALEIAERVAEAGRAEAAARSVAIEVSGSVPRIPVGAEPELLERALAPVVDNAIRHARGRVAIATQKVDRRLVFEVSDDGPGVDPAIRERMFEPGVTTRRGANGTGSGAGLGLTLTRRLVRAAEGDIACASTPGATRFTVSFPLA